MRCVGLRVLSESGRGESASGEVDHVLLPPGTGKSVDRSPLPLLEVEAGLVEEGAAAPESVADDCVAPVDEDDGEVVCVDEDCNWRGGTGVS